MSSFPDSLWAEIKKESGIHCMRRRDYKTANKIFQESLQHKSNKLDSVFRLANSQAREANLDTALELLDEKSGLGNTAVTPTKSFDRNKRTILNFLHRQLQAPFQLQSPGM